MFHRAGYALPDNFTEDQHDTTDYVLDQILKFGALYGWKPAVRRSSIHRSILAWYLGTWDGRTLWLRHVRIDRDLQSLARALRQAVPDLHTANQEEGDSLLHFFEEPGTALIEVMLKELENHLAQDGLDVTGSQLDETPAGTVASRSSQ
jgi:hypothetical protein